VLFWQVKSSQFRVLSVNMSQQSKHSVAESSQSSHAQLHNSHFLVALFMKKCFEQETTSSFTQLPVAISTTGVGLNGSHSRQNPGSVEHFMQPASVHVFEV